MIINCIPKESLQLFFDEAAEKDGIALRLWCFTDDVLLEEKRKKSANDRKHNYEGCWQTEWSNPSFFHTLIRFNERGRQSCLNRHYKKALDIHSSSQPWPPEQTKNLLWEFGLPISIPGTKLSGVLFGGLVKIESSNHQQDEWKELLSRLNLEEGSFFSSELENEFTYMRELSSDKLKHIYCSWQLFFLCLQSFFSELSEANCKKPAGNDILTWLSYLKHMHARVLFIFQLHQLIKKDLPNNYSVFLYFSGKKNDQSEASKEQIFNRTFELTREKIDIVSNEIVFDDGQEFLDIEAASKPSGVLPAPLIILSSIVTPFKSVIVYTKQNFDKSLRSKLRDAINAILLETVFSQHFDPGKDVSQGHSAFRLGKLMDNVQESDQLGPKYLINKVFNLLRDHKFIEFDRAVFCNASYHHDDRCLNDGNNPINHRLTLQYCHPYEDFERYKTRISDMDIFSTNPKQGSTAYAFRQGRLVVDRNVDDSLTYRRGSGEETIKTSLFQPVLYGDLVLGVISLARSGECPDVNRFSYQDIQLVDNIARFLGPILFQFTLQETVIQLNQALNRHELQGVKIQNLGESSLRSTMLQLLCRLVQADGANYWKINEASEQLEREDRFGRVPTYEVLNNQSASWALYKNYKKTHRLLRRNLNDELDNYTDPYPPLVEIQVLRDNKVHAILVLPVEEVSHSGESTVSGLISLYRIKHDNWRELPFSRISVQAVRTFSEAFGFHERIVTRFKYHQKNMERVIRTRILLAQRMAHNLNNPISESVRRSEAAKAIIQKHMGVSSFTAYNIGSIQRLLGESMRTVQSVLTAYMPLAASKDSIHSIQMNKIVFDQSVLFKKYVLPGKTKAISRQNIELELGDIRKIWGDKAAIEEVIRNLFENAIKYSDHESLIKISTGFNSDTKLISVKVSNYGKIGIPDNERETIFELGGRTEKAMRRHAASPGFGLFLARREAYRHGGNLVLTHNCEPVEFELTLPENELYNQDAALRTLQKNSKKGLT